MSQEKTYRLTPLGLFTTHIGDEAQAKKVADAVELYMRRSGLGMAIDKNRLAFVEMEPVEEDAK
jgi:hypothetical protein